MSLAEAAIGAGGNIFSSIINNEYAKSAQADQFRYNEKAAENADKRTRALYNDLYSPKAQMEQIKAAGLSPSIFASGGIAGKQGVSGAQGAGVSPRQVFGADPINAALAGAQIAKTKAETRKIEEDTELTQSQKTAQDLNNILTSETLSANIQQAYALAAKYNQEFQTEYWRTKNEQQTFEFDKETFDEKVQIIKNEVELGTKNILLAQSNIDLNNKKVEDIASQIATRAEQIAQGWVDLQIKGKSQEATEKYMTDQINQMIKELDFQKEKHVDDFIANLISGSINALGTALIGPIGGKAAKGILKLFTKK